MHIYPSARVLPYVYVLANKETGQFYFGSRTTKRLKLPSHLDLPQYQSSSKNVDEIGFGSFNWHIDSEFFDPDEAYWHEQRLIKEHWGDPLLLNKHFVDLDTGERKFSRCGTTNSEDHRTKLSVANKGKVSPKKGTAMSGDHKTRISDAKKGKVGWSKLWLVRHPDGSEETVANITEFCRLHGLSQGTMSSVSKGKFPSHKGYWCEVVRTE